MRNLPNGCWSSELTVFPSNWDKSGASIKTPWRVQYYFHDPAFKNDPKLKYGKLVVIKRMNGPVFNTLEKRREITKVIIREVYKMLEEEGYNPITKKFMAPAVATGDIEPSTNFIRALEMSKEKLKCSITTKRDIKSCLKFFELSAINLNLHGLQISQVRRKHVSRILDNCGKVKEYWSSHLFNHYRTYLMMCFKFLIKEEALESNPVDDLLEKEKTETKLRKLPSKEEVKLILDHFKDDHYFMRFFQIFFHSGDRPIELTRLKTTDVNLVALSYIKIDKKGNAVVEKEKPIKKIALEYWSDLMQEALPGQYLFGPLLKPGARPVTRDWITKKWQREIKDPETGLGLDVDLYVFKHKNLDEIAAYLTLLQAQKAAGHETPVITLTYAVGERERENDRIRNVPNVLGG